MIPFSLVTSLAGVAVGFGLAWQLQGHQIVKLELNYANERISQQRAARASIGRATTGVIVAQNNAANRTAVVRRDADAARSEYERLQSQSAAAVRAAATSLDACNRVAAAQGVVLAASTGFIQTVVTDADQCFSDQSTLKEAWPK